VVHAMTFINFEDDWIIDWGCCHHLTGDTSKFSSLENYNRNDAIITVDNTIYLVEKKVVLLLLNEGDPITLENVYHVPRRRKVSFR